MAERDPAYGSSHHHPRTTAVPPVPKAAPDEGWAWHGGGQALGRQLAPRLAPRHGGRAWLPALATNLAQISPVPAQLTVEVGRVPLLRLTPNLRPLTPQNK